MFLQCIICEMICCFPVVIQVFTVRSGGAAGVVVKGPDEKTSITFRFVFFVLHNTKI